MNKLNDKIKLNPILLKTVYAIFIAIFAVIGWYLIGTLNNRLIAKVISFILYFLIISYALYEYARILPLPKWTNYYFSLLGIFSFFNPWGNTYNWFLNDSNYFIHELIKEQYQYVMFGIVGLGYLFQAIFILIPFVLFQKHPFSKKKILYYFISYIVVIILTITGKSLLIANADSYLFVLVLYIGPIICDSFAYFGGMLFGNKLFKKKLAPKISPNKTIEGAIVGFIFTWLILFLIFNFLKFNELSSINSTLLLVIVPLVVPIIAIFGDLSFSWIKRIAKIKDFSNVIPGHGGLLDRIDSIALVSFIFLTLFIVV